jgi:hypothetical protein
MPEQIAPCRLVDEVIDFTSLILTAGTSLTVLYPYLLKEYRLSIDTLLSTIIPFVIVILQATVSGICVSSRELAS